MTTPADTIVRRPVPAVGTACFRQSGETHRHYVLFDYAAVWEAGDPVAGDDADHVEWISPDRLDSLGLWSETLRIITAARTLVQADSRIA